MPTFFSIPEALRAGYQFHQSDRTENGYLVRQRTADGWQTARIVLRQPSMP